MHYKKWISTDIQNGHNILNWKLPKSEFGENFKMTIISLPIFPHFIFYFEILKKLRSNTWNLVFFGYALFFYNIAQGSSSCLHLSADLPIKAMTRLNPFDSSNFQNSKWTHFEPGVFRTQGIRWCRFFFRHVTDINVDDSYQSHFKDQAYLIVLIGSIFEQNRG